MFVPAAGSVVAGRYALEHVIGRGGMGEVWQAHDRDLDSPCAIKFILGHLAGDEALRARFMREAKTVARLRSPHAVHILGVGEHEGALYLAMELLDGETLHARLSRERTLPPDVTFALVEQVAHALQKAHDAGVVHRDLKPENIWLWSEREMFAKVLDFGVAKSQKLSLTLQTATGALVGTPHYMSPEQAQGTREVDHRSDLWALAIIAVECLTGRRPFESQGLGDLLIKIVATPPPMLKELGPDLPPGLQSWWERALARDPERRFQSANELVQTLRLQLGYTGPGGGIPRSAPGSDATPAAAAAATPQPVRDVLARSVEAPTWLTADPSRVKVLRSGSMSPLTHTRPPRRRLPQGRVLAIAGVAAAAALGFAALRWNGSDELQSEPVPAARGAHPSVTTSALEPPVRSASEPVVVPVSPVTRVSPVSPVVTPNAGGSLGDTQHAEAVAEPVEPPSAQPTRARPTGAQRAKRDEAKPSAIERPKRGQEKKPARASLRAPAAPTVRPVPSSVEEKYGF